MWDNTWLATAIHIDYIYEIDLLLYGITADIQGMGPFGLILAPQPTV
jgi:hypothetical protein